MSKSLKDIVYNLYSNKIIKDISSYSIILPSSNGFRIIKTIKNENGKAVYIISNNKEERIAKVIPLHLVGNEIEIIEKLSKLDLSPIIFKTEIISNKDEDNAYIEMEKMTGTINDILSERMSDDDLNIISILVLKLLRKLSELSISHGDFHWKNIGFNYNSIKDGINLKVIDLEFGDFKVNERLDILQLIRTLDKKYMQDIDNYNRDYITVRLLKLYNSKYNKNISKKDIENEYEIFCR